jgi:hypothetical protein
MRTECDRQQNPVIQFDRKCLLCFQVVYSLQSLGNPPVRTYLNPNRSYCLIKRNRVAWNISNEDVTLTRGHTHSHTTNNPMAMLFLANDPQGQEFQHTKLYNHALRFGHRCFVHYTTNTSKRGKGMGCISHRLVKDNANILGPVLRTSSIAQVKANHTR